MPAHAKAHQFAQLSFASFSANPAADRSGGWGIGPSQSETPEQRKLLEEIAPRGIAGASAHGYLSEEQILKLPLRFAYLKVGEQGYYLQSVPAGEDASQRPNNVFTHAFVDMDVAGNDSPWRPIDFYASPSFARPYRIHKVDDFRPEAVTTADDGGPVANPKHEYGDIDFGAFAKKHLDVLLFLQRLIEAKKRVVLLTDGAADAYQWLCLLSLTMPPAVARTWLSFTTSEVPNDLLTAVRMGSEPMIHCVDRAAARSAQRVSRQAVIVDPTQPVTDTAPRTLWNEATARAVAEGIEFQEAFFAYAGQDSDQLDPGRGLARQLGMELPPLPEEQPQQSVTTDAEVDEIFASAPPSQAPADFTVDAPFPSQPPQQSPHTHPQATTFPVPDTSAQETYGFGASLQQDATPQFRHVNPFDQQSQATQYAPPPQWQEQPPTVDTTATPFGAPTLQQRNEAYGTTPVPPAPRYPADVLDLLRRPDGDVELLSGWQRQQLWSFVSTITPGTIGRGDELDLIIESLLTSLPDDSLSDADRVVAALDAAVRDGATINRLRDQLVHASSHRKNFVLGQWLASDRPVPELMPDTGTLIVWLWSEWMQDTTSDHFQLKTGRGVLVKLEYFARLGEHFSATTAAALQLATKREELSFTEYRAGVLRRGEKNTGLVADDMNQLCEQWHTFAQVYLHAHGTLPDHLFSVLAAAAGRLGQVRAVTSTTDIEYKMATSTLHRLPLFNHLQWYSQFIRDDMCYLLAWVRSGGQPSPGGSDRFFFTHYVELLLRLSVARVLLQAASSDLGFVPPTWLDQELAQLAEVYPTRGWQHHRTLASQIAEDAYDLKQLAVIDSHQVAAAAAHVPQEWGELASTLRELCVLAAREGEEFSP